MELENGLTNLFRGAAPGSFACASSECLVVGIYCSRTQARSNSL